MTLKAEEGEQHLERKKKYIELSFSKYPHLLVLKITFLLQQKWKYFLSTTQKK